MTGCLLLAAAMAVRASQWGFDAADSTAALQAALDSGVKHLIVDAMPTPWIVRPLRVRGGMTVEFEKGAVVEAKRGEFRGVRDHLLDLTGATNVVLRGYGATLRMRREDYAKPPYLKGEWRHGLALYRCRGVTVEGLTVEDSGGDGICLGNGAKDIVIRDVTALRNHRQGISICDAENVLIERSTFAETAGTPPSAGIDFEPDKPTERLKNIVLRECTMRNNAGAGFQVCLNLMDATSEPVSILIDNCRSEGNACGTSLIVCRKDRFVGGEVRYRRTVFKDERGFGIGFEKKPAGAAKVVFERCLLDRCCVKGKPEAPDVLLYPGKWDDGLPGDVTFEGLRIVQRAKKPWIGESRRTFGERSRNFRGAVKVTDPEGRSEIVRVDDAMMAKLFPASEGERPEPRYEIDFRETKVIDGAVEKMVALTPFAVANPARYVFFVNRPRKVRFVGRQVPHSPGGTVDRGQKLLVNGVHYRFFTMDPEPQEEKAEIVFDIPRAGWHTMRVYPSTPFTLLESDVPVALDLGYGAVKARLVDFNTPAKLWFDLPDRRLPFSFVFAGTGGNNRLQARMADVSGTELFSHDRILEWTVCNASQGGVPGLAELTLSRPTGAAFYYFMMDATGLPPYLFLSKEKTWHWAGVHRDADKRIPVDKEVKISD